MIATMQKERLRPLTIAERRELTTIAKAGSERVDRARRARALLAVAGGQPFGAAAAAGFRRVAAASYLVRRFNRAGLGALRIAPGRGRRPTYDAAARARIVAMAQRLPDRRAAGAAPRSRITPARAPGLGRARAGGAPTRP